MSKAVEGPTLDRLSVINEDGTRNHVHPADVTGRFNKAKPIVHWVLIGVYAIMPWIEVGGHPAILIDIPMRRFFLFGSVFNAQDFYLAFYLLTGIGFSLILVSALWGRLWCGWACPQTVFLEGVYRKVERWIDGNRNERIALAKSKWTRQKVFKRVLKHSIYLFISVNISHMFLSYFVSLPRLWTMVQDNPVENWTAFLWMAVLTGIIYFNFFWFREQLCLIICPYGRLQSALQDKDTLIIGYDEKRGEPRGKAKDPNAGACVDCRRCVQVCPTGIDIRNGLQMECIGCANCIDACDSVMVKLGRPTGLVRYDSRRGLDTGTRKFVRPRLFYYIFAGALGLSVATFMFSNRRNFEANILRIQGAPYTVVDDVVRNQLMIHVINKNPETSTFEISATPVAGVEFTIPQTSVELAPFKDHMLPVIASYHRSDDKHRAAIEFTVLDLNTKRSRQIQFELLGPRDGNGGGK